MPRALRIDVGNEIYHVLNRANGKQTIFHTHKDYRHFEQLLTKAQERTDMRILAYVLMPNHWHLVLYPKSDGDLTLFMQWLTLTHTQQYRARTETVGYGHLYQGRYKSFLVQKDRYLLQLIRYVERNALRAKLVREAENWQWGSAYRRQRGTIEEKRLLSEIPIEIPSDYLAWLNANVEEVDALGELRESINKGKPYGGARWVQRIVDKYNLSLTTRQRGRPKKNN